VGILLSDVSLDLTDFLAEASKSDPDIKFFGGISDEGRLGAKGRIFLADKQVTSGLALVIYAGEELQVEIFSSFGWRPLGRVMTITKMESPYIIKEIDRRPALEVYEKYLDIHRGESFFWEALTFPICAQRDGEYVARHPREVRSDGALVFGADFRPGEHVRLTYGDPEGIIKHAQVLKKGIHDFAPQNIFIISCVARWLLLQHDVTFELEACRGTGASYGYYAFGEFLRNKQEVTLSNMNMVAVCMREGEAVPVPEAENLTKDRQLTSQTSIMRHLVYFVNAMSYEVEATDVRLKSVARTDWLTDLKNRSEMEKTIGKGLAYVQASGQQMAVLIVDIDNFRGIYDTYGHEIGDQALQQVADVLRSQTRKVDSPGRWGGDVFMVLLVGMSLDRAYGIAERIRERVHQIEIIPGGDCLTVSLGLTVSSQDDDEAKLLKRADKALYRAKAGAGGDSVSALDEKGLVWHTLKEDKKPKGKAKEESRETEKKAPKRTRKKKAEEG
jgi:diguanylate cyclase (GGDEF)-like protein